MYLKAIILFVIIVVSSVSACAQVCVGGTTSYRCSNINAKFRWAVSGTGWIREYPTDSDCDLRIRWTIPGTYTVTYYEIGPDANEDVIYVYVYAVAGGAVTANAPTICRGGNSTLTVSGHSGNIVRWERSTNGNTWESIAHTGTSYTATNIQTTTTYRAVLNQCSNQATSLSATVSVEVPAPAYISVVSGSPSYCSDESTSFTLQAGSDSGRLKYWEYSEQSNGGWMQIGGGHDINTHSFYVSVPTRIRAVFSSSHCGDIYTKEISAGPLPGTTAGGIAISGGARIVCAGQAFTLSVNGNVGDVIQWYMRDNEHGWANLPSPGNISIYRETYFKALVQNGNCIPRETPEYAVTIKPAAEGFISPPDQTVCGGESAYFSLFEFSGRSVKWQKKDEGTTTWETVSESTSPTFRYGPLSKSATWRAVFANECGIEKVSNLINTTVLITVVSPQTSDISICQGDVAVLKVNNPQPAPVRYFWYTYENEKYIEERITTSNEYRVSGLTASKTYYVSFEQFGCMGPRTSLKVNLYNTIQMPSAPAMSISHEPAYNMRIYKNNSATSEITYYWQTELNGKQTVNTADILEMPKEGLYYVRGKNASGCWGASSMPVAVINHAPQPVAYAPSQVNYVRTYNFLKPSTTTQYPANRDDEADPKKLNVSTSYIEGLGRPIQKVIKKGAPQEQDIVLPFEYDEAGRSRREYLPYVSTAQHGALRVNPFVDQRSFYSHSEKTAVSYFPFSYQEQERSPTDRVVATYAPGEAWSGLAGDNGGRAVAQHYLSNTTADNVKVWQVDVKGLPFYNRSYGPGLLFVFETTDEHGFKTREFRTKENVAILKRVQFAAGPNDWADTYYIYDDFGNLVIVIPPEAVARLASEYHHAAANDTTRNAFLSRWAFRYVYDGRKRMVQKQVPGAEPVYMVYDPRDRLVMIQDGEQRDKYPRDWSFIKYDGLNRVILTGIIKDPYRWEHKYVQDFVNDFYNGIPDNGNAWFEIQGSDIHGYTNKSYPPFPVENDYLTVTYYDDYSFKKILKDSSQYTFRKDVLSDQDKTYFKRLKGLVTGTKVKVLDGESFGELVWLTTVNYYDKKYRAIQSISDNYKGGVDCATSVFDFTGKVLVTKTSHLKRSIAWKDLAGTQFDGYKLVKTGGTDMNWGDGSAVSVQVLSANQSGWVELTASENTTQRILGLTEQNANIQSINYGIMLRPGGKLVVQEKNIIRLDTVKYEAGDVLRMERAGAQVVYKKNGRVIFTSPTSSTASLGVAASCYNVNATLANVKASFGSTVQEITQRMEYDHANRLLKVWHKVGAGDEVLLTKNEYNALGELVTKKLHDTNPPSTADAARTFKQVVDYRYTIRGWLKRINNSDVTDITTDPGQPRDYFGMELAYNDDMGIGVATPQYNGNISAIRWSANAGFDAVKERAYSYTYDPMNRLTGAAYKVKKTSWGLPEIKDSNGNNIQVQAFSESGYGYDLNGNILRLTRNAADGSVLDKLAYNYGLRGNLLQRVTDTGNKSAGFIDGSNTTSDYVYDHNGNMTADRNKGITGAAIADGNSVIAYNHLNLPVMITKNTNDRIRYIYDATGRKLRQVVHLADQTVPLKFSDYSNVLFYERDTLKFINHAEGRIVMTEAVPEYQYHLKDHLGNVRLTFTTKAEAETNMATLEAAKESDEQNQFLYYNEAVKVNSSLFDHTNDGASQPSAKVGYATRLSGTNNERYGLAKTLSVMPGDVVKIEVFAKYLDGNNNNWSQALRDFMTSITTGGNAPKGTIIDGGSAGSIGTTVFPYTGLLSRTGDNGTGPKAYLNWLVFDRNFKYIDGGFRRLSSTPLEKGQNVAHERLAYDLMIKEAGYVYIYLSNENESSVDVFFDDFKVEQVESPVVQMDDYYPFGLTFNEYQRENFVPNQYQNTGREKQNELNLGWIDFGARMYQSETGRWNSIDFVADMFDDESPYCYAANNPVNVVDIGGYFRISAEFANKYPTLAKMIAWYLPLLQTNKTVKDAWMHLTTGTSAQFDEMVTYGSGPEIVPTQPENASIWNQNDPASSEDSNFSPKHPDKLFIAPGSLQELEEEMKKAMNGQENEMGAQMFLVTIKIMHEATHYGVFKYRGEDAFWRIEGNAGPFGGDQGAQWEGGAYQRFSYKNGRSNPADKGEVFNYYHKNYNEGRMRGTTLQPNFYYNLLMLMGPTPGTGGSNNKTKKKPDADKEAKKRSG